MSRQSEVVADRAELEEAVASVEAELGGAPVPRPETWGGYRLVPEVMEFWSGRESRLHDRLRVRRQRGDWEIDRLAP